MTWDMGGSGEVLRPGKAFPAEGLSWEAESQSLVAWVHSRDSGTTTVSGFV